MHSSSLTMDIKQEIDIYFDPLYLKKNKIKTELSEIKKEDTDNDSQSVQNVLHHETVCSRIKHEAVSVSPVDISSEIFESKAVPYLYTQIKTEPIPTNDEFFSNMNVKKEDTQECELSC